MGASNGLFEEGKGLSPKELLEAAQAVKADEVILTDVLFDNNATVEAALECYDHFLSKKAHNDFAFFACPQGDDRTSWLNCYMRLSNLPFVRTLGLSKLAIPYCCIAPRYF